MKRIIALLFILFLAGPAFAQDAPAEPVTPQPIDVTPARNRLAAPLSDPPTLSERVSSVHAALMQAVVAFESGANAQETADARVAIARTRSTPPNRAAPKSRSRETPSGRRSSTICGAS